MGKLEANGAGRGRNGWVDALRGVSILLVLLLHFHLAFRLDRGWLTQAIRAEWLKDLARNGNYGVTIFFVISGFLITGTSLARFGGLDRMKPARFYAYRFARIVPNLLLMLGLVLLGALAGLRIFANEHGVPWSGTLLSIATFTHNVFMRRFGYFNYCLNILWSLSVEEAFYLVFPLVCLLLKREGRILAFWAALVAIAPIYRHFHRHDEIVALYGYLSCFDGIAVGCLVALLARRYPLPALLAWPIRIAAAFVMVYVYFAAPIMRNVVGGVSLMALATGALLYTATLTSPGREIPILSQLIAGLQALGRNSYELYLFHVVLLALLKTLPAREVLAYHAKPFWLAGYLVASTILAAGVAQLYAEPLNRRIRALLTGAKPQAAGLRTAPTQT